MLEQGLKQDLLATKLIGGKGPGFSFCWDSHRWPVLPDQRWWEPAPREGCMKKNNWNADVEVMKILCCWHLGRAKRPWVKPSQGNQRAGIPERFPPLNTKVLASRTALLKLTHFQSQITLHTLGSWRMPSSSVMFVFLLAKHIWVLHRCEGKPVQAEFTKALQTRKRQIILYISIMASLIHVLSKLYRHDLSNLSLHGGLSMPLIISFALL